MCGIAGILDLKENPAPENRIRAMVQSLKHRGPDDQGIWIERNVGFGHTRLAIIDLSPSGHQPMISCSGRYAITYNGEIYNHRFLRKELEEAGIRFRGTSDTEVLLEGFAMWGPQVLDRLEGMFAFAVWDRTAKSLFLTRDRFGEKPLHYLLNGDQLLFGSEIKALLAAGGFDDSWDPEAISDYLSLGYILSPKTLYRQIRRLPAACYAIWNSGRLEIHEYWDLKSVFERKQRKVPSQLAEQLLAELDHSVEARSVADVPVGAFLSGGIDSSSVVAALCKMRPQPPETFTISFDHPSYDESSWAALTARALGTHHHVQAVEDDDLTVFKGLPAIFDEPFADSSAIPMWHLAKMTRRFVTVALSGDGADEIMGGYPTYQADQWFRTYAKIPLIIRRGLGDFAMHWPHRRHSKVGMSYRIRQFFLAGTGSAPDAHSRWRELFSARQKANLLQAHWQRMLRDYDPFQTMERYFQNLRGMDFLDACMYVDMKTWLQDDILIKLDRTTMAHSLETRVPFLDSRLVQWCASLPISQKIAKGQGKLLLKIAMASRLPRKIINRKKSGFNAPTYMLPLDLSDNEWLTAHAGEQCQTEYQRYALAVLGMHMKHRQVNA